MKELQKSPKLQEGTIDWEISPITYLIDLEMGPFLRCVPVFSSRDLLIIRHWMWGLCFIGHDRSIPRF